MSCNYNLADRKDGAVYIRNITAENDYGYDKALIRKEIAKILKLANCKNEELIINKVSCNDLSNSKGFYNYYICEAHTTYGYFTITEDMVDNLHISYMRYD